MGELSAVSDKFIDPRVVTEGWRGVRRGGAGAPAWRGADRQAVRTPWWTQHIRATKGGLARSTAANVLCTFSAWLPPTPPLAAVSGSPP